jgi:hypothetical protein
VPSRILFIFKPERRFYQKYNKIEGTRHATSLTNTCYMNNNNNFIKQKSSLDGRSVYDLFFGGGMCLNSGPGIYYALSFTTELSSRGRVHVQSNSMQTALTEQKNRKSKTKNQRQKKTCNFKRIRLAFDSV